MNADTYQALAKRTLIDKPDHKPTAGDIRLIYAALEMAILAGKIAELVKKGVCHQQGTDYPLLSDLTDQIARLAFYFDGEPRPEPTDEHYMRLWNTLGLLGEAAELAEIVTAAEPDLEAAKKEAGDLCWYTSAILTKLGLWFGDVLLGNIVKLNQRFPNGWNPADSRAKADEGR